MSAERTTRAEDEAVLADHYGTGFLDDVIMRAAFRRFGWKMLSDDAAAWMADEYEAREERREAMNAANRAIYEARA